MKLPDTIRKNVRSQTGEQGIELGRVSLSRFACRNQVVGFHGDILWPNEKLSDCRRKRKVEREWHVRIVAQRRAESRGGSSSPAVWLRREEWQLFVRGHLT